MIGVASEALSPRRHARRRTSTLRGHNRFPPGRPSSLIYRAIRFIPYPALECSPARNLGLEARSQMPFGPPRAARHLLFAHTTVHTIECDMFSHRIASRPNLRGSPPTAGAQGFPSDCACLRASGRLAARTLPGPGAGVGRSRHRVDLPVRLCRHRASCDTCWLMPWLRSRRPAPCGRSASATRSGTTRRRRFVPRTPASAAVSRRSITSCWSDRPVCGAVRGWGGPVKAAEGDLIG
jgi:hypothetical protein